MPTIASFLGVKIPREQLMEIDGVSFTGQLSAESMQATIDDDKIRLSWKAIDKKGSAKSGSPRPIATTQAARMIIGL